MPGSRHVLTGHPHERSGKVRQSRGRGFVGEDTRVELLRQPLPGAAFDPIGEAEAFVIYFDSQVHATVRRNRDRRRESVGLNLVRQAAHDAHVFADSRVVRDVEVVELAAVVVTDETRHLLEVLRLYLDSRRGAVAERLLTTCDESLAKLTADGFSPVQSKVAGTGGQAEELVRKWRAQPLKGRRQSRPIEVFAQVHRSETGVAGARAPSPR